MSCPHMEVQLNEYVDGTLAASHRVAVEDHLAGCTACRAAVAELRELAAEARNLPSSIEPARDLWAGVEARIVPKTWRRLALTAAAVVALALGIYRLLPPSTALDRPAGVGWVALQADFDRSSDELSRTLETERDRLSPETAALLERNLRIIDAAIADSRAALARDSANVELRDLVADAARQKVELLQWAVRAAEL